jgi:hypothetical protein
VPYAKLNLHDNDDESQERPIALEQVFCACFCTPFSFFLFYASDFKKNIVRPCSFMVFAGCMREGGRDCGAVGTSSTVWPAGACDISLPTLNIFSMLKLHFQASDCAEKRQKLAQLLCRFEEVRVSSCGGFCFCFCFCF